MESSTGTSFPLDMERTGNHAGKETGRVRLWTGSAGTGIALVLGDLRRARKARLAVAMGRVPEAPTGCKPTVHDEPGLLLTHTHLGPRGQWSPLSRRLSKCEKWP
jgi:hypothetical protein